MKKIAVCPNPYRDLELEYTRETLRLLSEAGFEGIVCPVFSETGDACLPGGLSYHALSEALPQCDMAVVIGGDGTILAVSRSLGEHSLPLLGVNLGTKGFMAAVEPEQLGDVVKAARGECAISRRMMLDVTLEREGEVIAADCALNDAVIHGYGDCVFLTAWCDGERMTAFSGDGVIVSTPTGSTGYSMSAGGPIVEPEARALVFSPICAHVMSSRSFVLGAGREIRVKTEKIHSRRAYLSVDGSANYDLVSGDVMTVRASKREVLMANPGRKSFYELIFDKLR